MEVRTVLVDFDIEFLSPTLLACAVGLANKFDAEIIGHASAEALVSVVGVRGAVTTARAFAEKRQAIEARLAECESEFRAGLPIDMRRDWVDSLLAPTESILRIAARADVILVESLSDNERARSRRADVGEIALAAGRPVLAVGAGISEVRADKMLVGWKNTREARRAVSDALPLMRDAEVLVATIAEGDLQQERASLDSLVAWLRRHAITARSEVHTAQRSPTDTLIELGRSFGADVLVTGAYGHNRLQERIFGGMTRDLLQSASISRFMSN